MLVVSSNYENMKNLVLSFLVFSFNLSFGQQVDNQKLKDFASEVFVIIENNSIEKTCFKTSSFRKSVFDEIERNKYSTEDELMKEVIETLQSCGDRHSFYSNRKQTAKKKSKETKHQFPDSKIIKEKFGYLSLPAFTSLSSDLKKHYTDTLRTQIERLDKQYKIEGWIVDLRDNTGGNMWPMIAGLNPLIKDNTVGYFTYDNGKSSKWKSRSKRPQGVAKPTNTYKCENLNNKIAVILNNRTSSSGEMTAISLIGLDRVKTFGKETAGYTSVNSSYNLSNKAMLFLATGYSQNRNKITYKNTITPDFMVEDSMLMKTVEDWLSQ